MLWYPKSPVHEKHKIFTRPTLRRHLRRFGTKK